MLSRHAAAKLTDDFQNLLIKLFTFPKEHIRCLFLGAQNVQVQIAVSDVTKPDDLKARITGGHRLIYALEEGRDLRDPD